MKPQRVKQNSTNSTKDVAVSPGVAAAEVIVEAVGDAAGGEVEEAAVVEGAEADKGRIHK